jgi:hypothetical protein
VRVILDARAEIPLTLILSPKGRGKMGIKSSRTTPSPLRGEGWGEGEIRKKM